MRKYFRRAFSYFERLANASGYWISWRPPVLLTNTDTGLSFDLEFVIAHLMLRKRDLFFIQIGANDGVSNDPLFRFVNEYGWRGILVEPLPEVFELLKKNYAGKANLKFVNAAISEQDGFRTLYTVRIDTDTFSLAHEFSSFRKEVVAQQTTWVPDIAERIEETRVKCISLDTLLKEADGNEVDILQVDTEGYDLEILKMIDFSRLHPPIICYEHCNLNKAEQQAAAQLLIGHGYRLTRDNLDTIAYRPLATFGWR